MDTPRVLVIEADPGVQQSLVGALQGRGYDCLVTSTAEEALAAVAQDDFVFTLLDTRLDITNQRDLLHALKIQGHDPGPLVGFEHGIGRDRSSEAQPAGLDAFLRLPFGREKLDVAIGDALQTLRVRHQPEELLAVQQQLALWRSPKMVEVAEIIREAARVDVTVLVTGETGTGKDLAARAIHSLSLRRTGPYVKVNCAAVPRELLESELFGHERGAFTGAHKLKVGRFEAAHRGTIFLDEIGDLHPALQAKLLHVLQDGDFSRVGGKSTLKFDVRVLAATNQDLERAVGNGSFREDLYYRLNVIQVVVPPLRERLEEIPHLVDYFMKKYTRLFGRNDFSISPAVMERLVRHSYPGNVRELENMIKRMIVLRDPFLTRMSVPERSRQVAPSAPPPTAVADLSLKDISRRASIAAEREAISNVLEQTGWNRVRAAKALKISYRALLYKIKRVGLNGARPSVHSAVPNTPDQSGGLPS